MLTIYTTNTCAYCVMVKKFLDMKKVKYEVVNLDQNPEKRQELFAKTNAMTVPIAELGGEYVIGWNVGKLNQLIANGAV